MPARGHLSPSSESIAPRQTPPGEAAASRPKNYRILSIDGGGVRGVYAAKLLEMLEAEVTKRCRPNPFSNINLFAGASTGGIIALGLASGLSSAELVALYRDNAGQIFPSRCRALRKVKGIVRARYSNAPLKRILNHTFTRALGTPEPRLADIPRHVLVPVFDLAGEKKLGGAGAVRMWKPKFFNNFKDNAGRPNPDLNESIVDVAMRTSAAPTYLPVYQGDVDGGMVSNNPSMAALAQALDAEPRQPADIRLFSLGTGMNPFYIAGQSMKWGDIQWVCHKLFPDLVMDGMTDVADYQCRRILNGRPDDVPGNRYFRLDPLVPEAIALDDSAATGKLIELAEKVPSDPASAPLWTLAVQWWLGANP